MVEGCSGRFDGRVNVVGRGSVDGADFFLVGGVDACDELARGGFDKLVVDEKAGGQGKVSPVRGREIDCKLLRHSSTRSRERTSS